MRVAVNREFFGGPAAEIVRVVLQAAAEAQGGPDVQMPVASAQELLAEGDRHLFGQGDTFEDGSEACRFYKLAAARGCVVAPERLGAVYGQVDSRSRSGRRRAIKYLKEGARRGNYYCYVEMAVLFAAVRHEANFRKAWDKFFADRAASPCAEAEAGEFRYVAALRRYVCGCIDMQLPPAHLAELSAEAAPLMHHLLAALHQLCNNSEQRMRLAGALRWTYENLAPRPVDTQRAPQGWVQGWVQRLETA
jgi:FAD/FMN-containing dehydrogenase